MSNNSIVRSPSPTGGQSTTPVNNPKSGFLAKITGAFTSAAGKAASHSKGDLRATASTSHVANIQTPLTTASSIQQLHDSVKDPKIGEEIALFAEKINALFTNLVKIDNPQTKLEHYQAAQNTIQTLQKYRQGNGLHDSLEIQLGIFTGTIGEKIKTVQQILAIKTASHPQEAKAAASQANSDLEAQPTETAGKLSRSHKHNTGTRIDPRKKVLDQQPSTNTPTAIGVEESLGAFDQISEV